MPASRSTPSSSYSSIGIALGLQPVRRRAAAILAVLALRNHALKPGLVDQVEDRLRLARQRLAELDAAARLDHAGQDLAAVLQRHVAQIVAIEVQQIEGDEIEVVLPAGDGLAQFAEVGQAGLVQDDDLAVDDRALGAEVRRPPSPGRDISPSSRGRCACRSACRRHR